MLDHEGRYVLAADLRPCGCGSPDGYELPGGQVTCLGCMLWATVRDNASARRRRAPPAGRPGRPAAAAAAAAAGVRLRRPAADARRPTSAGARGAPSSPARAAGEAHEADPEHDRRPPDAVGQRRRERRPGLGFAQQDLRVLDEVHRPPGERRHRLRLDRRVGRQIDRGRHHLVAPGRARPSTSRSLRRAPPRRDVPAGRTAWRAVRTLPPPCHDMTSNAAASLAASVGVTPTTTWACPAVRSRRITRVHVPTPRWRGITSAASSTTKAQATPAGRPVCPDLKPG